MSPRNRAGGDLDEWVPPTNTRWNVNDGGTVAAAMVKSGLSRNAFARKYGLPAHRVKYWVDEGRSPDAQTCSSATRVQDAACFDIALPRQAGGISIAISESLEYQPGYTYVVEVRREIRVGESRDSAEDTIQVASGPGKPCLAVDWGRP